MKKHWKLWLAVLIGVGILFLWPSSKGEEGFVEIPSGEMSVVYGVTGQAEAKRTGVGCEITCHISNHTDEELTIYTNVFYLEAKRLGGWFRVMEIPVAKNAVLNLKTVSPGGKASFTESADFYIMLPGTYRFVAECEWSDGTEALVPVEFQLK